MKIKNKIGDTVKTTELEMVIEAALFVAGEPVSLERLSIATAQDIKTARSLVENLAYKYEVEKRGLVIIEVNDSFQMCTNPKYFENIKTMYKKPTRKTLTQTLMETLAIIAYKQPVTKSQIEEIRGVSCEHSVNKLIDYELVCEKGRLQTPGKPIVFGTTDVFLKFFGFPSINHLPTVEDDFESLKIEATKEIDNQLRYF